MKSGLMKTTLAHFLAAALILAGAAACSSAPAETSPTAPDTYQAADTPATMPTESTIAPTTTPEVTGEDVAPKPKKKKRASGERSPWEK
jgi:hypothetical protein